MSGGLSRLGAAGCALALWHGWASAEVVFPPVHTSGSLGISYRIFDTNQGTDSRQRQLSGVIDANSFIWRPWIAIWSARLGLTQLKTESNNTTTSLITTGDARLSLFPQSRFPNETFITVADTETDIEGSTTDGADFRTVIIGSNQQYQTPDGRYRFRGRIERAEQTDNSTEGSDVGWTLQGNAAHYRDFHNYDADLLLRNIDRGGGRGSDQSLAFNGRHLYRPSSELVVENGLTYDYIDNEFAGRSTGSTEFRVRNSTTYHPRNKPYRMRGLAEYARRTTEPSGDATNALTANGSLSYDFSERLRGSLDVSASAAGSDSDDYETRSNQSATLTYTALPIEFSEFTYNWFVSSTVGNELSSEVQAQQSASLSGGHSLSRSFLPIEESPLSISMELGQNATVTRRTDRDDTTTLSHRASTGLTLPTQNSVSTLRLSAVDSRVEGTIDSVVQSVNLTGAYNYRITRYSSVSSDFFSGLVKTRIAGDDNTDEASNFNLRFEHGRLFLVRGLRFRSEFGIESDLLYPFTLSEEDGGLLHWDNRLDYSIGLLDIKLSADFSRSGSRENRTFFVGATRRF